MAPGVKFRERSSIVTYGARQVNRERGRLDARATRLLQGQGFAQAGSHRSARGAGELGGLGDSGASLAG
jgi:hypothetical protein